MHHDVIRIFCVGLLGLATQACGGAQSTEPNTPDDEGAPKTLVDDDAERKQLKADVSAAIASIDKELKALGDRMDATTDSARADIERDIKRLQERRADLAAALRRIDAQANETFREVRSEIQGLLKDVGLRGQEEAKD